MRTYFFVIALNTILFGQCTKPESATPRVDYDKESIKLMSEVAPQISGQWTMQEVAISHKKGDYYQQQAQITKDTVLKDIATLTIKPVSNSRFSPRQAQHPEFEGNIQYGGKTYPIYFFLTASAGRIDKKTGPQASILFEYSFPSGSRLIEAEESYLKNAGIVNTNYSVEVVDSQPAMIWRGGKGVDQIRLEKNR
ncbi:hypothetical protein [Fibrivirga algicola]|uniref:DUF5004 domain-containing protein n=1 Tax=Fibrivirga algicola TaxID=2950420 RepID=A0ABX0QFM2_9BACT|nr:hypothetical protein [Fibrivirga algicola]ARK08955.1 hypothetical protein A6C57_00755 [Fibrella sp. ES10-3-2-2]NID08864.1 hypothetical protein [Fibrivirga algicola]